MIEALQIIDRLLLKYGHDGDGSQANFVQRLISLREEGSPKFYEELTGISVWGSAGSITDIHLYVEGRDISAEEERRDNSGFRKAIISIAELMDEEGMGTERARWIASVFKQWNEKGY